MKKYKSFKKLSAKATSLLLCLATSATCMTLAVPYLSAVQAEGEDNGVVISDSQIDIAGDDGVQIADSCDYGSTFDVPAGAIVTAPNGAAVSVPDTNKVLADQIGNYKVTVEGTNEDGATLSYDFYVRVRLDEEYFLKVDYNGADIPSYVKTGSTFTLPKAGIYYYDENNILREYKDGDYTIKVSDSFSNNNYSFNDGNPTFTAPNTTGKVFITYDAVAGTGTKHFSQTFTVNVQSTVQTGGNPTLSVSGVQRDVSVNRAVTLPTATATDSYDDNVKVEIVVTDPEGNKVKNVDIDENGYAVKNDELGDVMFDNDKCMTFYPTQTGSYKVTYTAYNDTEGKSSTREYYITVSDLVAPVFKNIEEWRIPETWGLTVYGENDYEVADSGKITFTVPEVVDNKDHMPANEEDKDDLISVYFRITDSDNSKTIVEFTNILATGDSNDKKFTYTDTYGSEKKGDTVTFDKDTPFVFDFSEYNKTNSAGDKQELAGTYTVLYRARDMANNTSSKTYTITLQESYTDNAKPTTAEVTVPEYISAADKTFTVPQASVADALDTRLHKVYKIYNHDGDSLDVEGGEIADIENGKLIFNKGKDYEQTLDLTDKLYFYVSATDKAGNFRSNATDDEDYTTCDAVVSIIGATSAEDVKYSGSSMTVKTGTKKAGETVSYGGFTVEVPASLRNYVGFEVAAYDPSGNVLNVTLETMSKIDGEKARIYVQNISFNLPTATEAGEFYTLTVRIFDVNGNNYVYGYQLGDVDPSGNGTVDTSALTTIGSGMNGEVATTYKLKNDVIKGIPGNADDVYYVVRKISGGTFALMGSEFTAKTQGAYTVYSGYIADNDVRADSFDYDNATIKETDNFSVSDTAAPVIELQGVMPTYVAFPTGENVTKKVNVELPTITAYTDNGMAEVAIEVKGPKPGKIDIKDGDNGNKYFEATADGAYEVTVTATYANAAAVSATYTINVGDVQGPEFTLVDGDGTTSVTGTYTVGTTFKFAILKLEDESESGVEITKTLIDPSKETVSDATITGSYTNNKDRLDNGTDITFGMAGTYKVVYTAKDAYGNETKQEFEITVVSSGTSTPTTWTTLSTVLIVVAIVLLAGVIVYVVRFRKVKK